MSFSSIFRLFFVIFSLYLLGDAFYRWDGFSFYASFYEFLPSIALVLVIWSAFALLAALTAWISLKVLDGLCSVCRIRASSDQVFMGAGLLMVSGGLIWTSKKLFWTEVQTSSLEKLLIVLSAALLSVFIAWMLRSRAERFVKTLFEGITPLVWIFGIILGLSLPVVTFYALWEAPDKTVPEAAVRSQGDDSRPNIILVTYDALTVKDMSLHGYYRETTPFIKEWAKSATVFEKYEAAANTTSQTVASLMTGKRVWSHKRHQSDAGEPADIDTESLPLLLKESGYYNMAFISNDIASVKKLGLSDSFDVEPSSSETMEPASIRGVLHKLLMRYFGPDILLYDWILKEDFVLSMLLQADFFRYPSRMEFPVRKVFDMFLDEIDNNSQQPYFAWLHTYPPHAPYLPPEPYMGMFDPSPEFRTAKSQYPLVHPRYYSPEQQPAADIIRARYDEFIRYCDEEFKYFIEQLSLKGKLDNTVIILSSDHGESFERGYFTHGGHFLYEEMTNIPLIVKLPEQQEGRKVDFPVEQIDLSATILDLAGISVPSWMDGRSLEPALRGEEMEGRPVYSMSMEEVHDLKEISRGIFAVWEGDYKLIHYITSKENLLFNLKQDPNEQNNIYESEPDIAARLLGLILSNLSDAYERGKGKD